MSVNALNTNEKAKNEAAEATATATTTTTTASSSINKLPSEILKSDLPSINEMENNVNFDITDNDLATEWVKEFENLEEKSNINDYWNDLQSEWNSLAS